MQIILTGGGDSKYFKSIDRKFKKLMPALSNIMLIPVATNRRNHSYCLKRIKETFDQLKFNKISVCSELDKLKYDTLELHHALYIDGGNTFKLIQSIRNSNFKKLVTKFIAKNGIINADSAGAIVLGKNISTALIGKIADKNSVQINKYQGMNMLYNYSIHCHFDPKEEMQELLKFSKLKGATLALTEKTAIYLNGRKGEVIGLGHLYIFKNGKLKVIKPKERFNL